MSKYLLAAAVLCLSIPAQLNAQDKTISWGLLISPAKHYHLNYAEKEVFVPGISPTTINETDNNMLRSDLAVYVGKQFRRKYFEFGLGLGSDEYVLNKEAVAGDNYISQQAVIAANYTLRPHLAFQYLLYGKRALDISWRAGFSYDVKHFKKDYNYVNRVLKAAFRDEIIINLLGEPVVIDFTEYYAFPRAMFSTGLVGNIHRLGIGIMFDYKNKSLDIFKPSKPYLINELWQLRLQIGLLLHNKYSKR